MIDRCVLSITCEEAWVNEDITDTLKKEIVGFFSIAQKIKTDHSSKGFLCNSAGVHKIIRNKIKN